MDGQHEDELVELLGLRERRQRVREDLLALAEHAAHVGRVVCRGELGRGRLQALARRRGGQRQGQARALGRLGGDDAGAAGCRQDADARAARGAEAFERRRGRQQLLEREYPGDPVAREQRA